MTAKTTASLQIDDLEKAKHLTFDPAFYDSILGHARGRESSESLYLPSSSVRTMGSCTFMAPGVTTEAIKPERIEQLVSIATRNATISGAWARYTIKPSLNSERNNTHATKDPDSSLAGLINRFRHNRKIAFATRIADRLDYLLEVSREEQPEQAPPSAGSLEGFLTFLTKTPGLTYPAVVLTFEGHVRAEWTRGPIQHFAIEFRDDEDVRFVIFAPDPKRPYKTVRVSGTATVDSVMDQARYYGVPIWAAGEDAQAA